MLRAKGPLYELLLKGSGSRFDRTAILSGLQARISALRGTSLSQRGGRSALDEIRRMVEAIEARDEEAAVRTCTEHLDSAAAAVLGAFTPTS